MEERTQNGNAQGPSPLVFLDTNVVVNYLRGEKAATELFSAEAAGKVQLAVNPIVLQELILAAGAGKHPEFEQLRAHLQVLPLDYPKASLLLEKLRALRNRISHSNNVLILSSADSCDFLVTLDGNMKSLATAPRPRVVTPEEMVTQLRAA